MPWHTPQPPAESPMPTTKPDKYAQPKAYKAWVRGKLIRWDPADDHGAADVYEPRTDGILWDPNDADRRKEVKASHVAFSEEAPKLEALEVAREEADHAKDS